MRWRLTSRSGYPHTGNMAKALRTGLSFRLSIVVSTAVLLLALGGGLALATGGGKPGHSAARHAKQHAKPRRDQESERAEKKGLPTWTHGYLVSKAAHDTPPGPGHGAAVSAVARGGS